MLSVRSYLPEIFLILIFLGTRLINLNGLPIFNDEGIYLDWGWREINISNNLYYSLFDGKQPLLMWIFGIFQSVIKDPLIAGRLVSVMASFLTLIGIYLISKKLFDRSIARLSALLYILIPIFVFFDRQALMESSISAIGVWVFYFFILNISKPRLIFGIILGALIGLGLFIKLSASLFLFAFLLGTFYTVFKSNDSKYKRKFISSIAIVLPVSLIILYPLITQENFGKIMEMNSRFAYSFTETFINTNQILIKNITATIQILFWHLNPILFVIIIISIAISFKNGVKNFNLLLGWILSTILIFMLFVKNPSPRYIVPLLPIITIIIAFGGYELWKLNKKAGIILATGVYISLFFTYTLVMSPLSYFYLMGRLTPAYSSQEYIQGWTSGYGVKDAYDYLNDIAKNEKIKMTVRVDYGNPESSIFAYSNNNKKIKTTFIDFECENSKAIFSSNNKRPAYFISRGLNFDGNEKCLKEIKKFYKPYGNEFVGVYKINQQ